MAEFSLVHRMQPARAGRPPHPALILLHGRGADESDLLPLGEQLDPRLLILSARAPFQFPGGGYVWYDLGARGVGYPDSRTLTASLDSLGAFLEEAKAAYPIDAGRVFLGGFSNGATVAASMALLHPEAVAGAAVLSGYFPVSTGLAFRPEASAGHPIFEGHGAADPVIPIAWARAGRDALAQMPIQLTYREYVMGHEIGRQELDDLSTWLSSALDGPGAQITPAPRPAGT